MAEKVKLPMGVENFVEMRTGEFYYVDKTGLIKTLLENPAKVNLFTRPRRFGETLAQSMLKTFFEKEILPDGTVADNSVYFQGKKIMEAGEEYTKHIGQYPVIFLSLKSAKQPTFEMAYENLAYEILMAFFNGFYDKMVSFIRSLFESALKTNESLKMAV